MCRTVGSRSIGTKNVTPGNGYKALFCFTCGCPSQGGARNRPEKPLQAFLRASIVKCRGHRPWRRQGTVSGPEMWLPLDHMPVCRFVGPPLRLDYRCIDLPLEAFSSCALLPEVAAEKPRFERHHRRHELGVGWGAGSNVSQRTPSSLPAW